MMGDQKSSRQIFGEEIATKQVKYWETPLKCKLIKYLFITNKMSIDQSEYTQHKQTQMWARVIP